MPRKKCSPKPPAHPKNSIFTWIVALVIVAFAFVAVVPAVQQADASGNFFLAGKKIVKKKAVVKKKTSAKTSTKKTTAGFKDADYTGPFPAPEGTVLNGTFGEDKFQDPTGSGAFKFKTQIAWARPVICLDETRLHVGSKGTTWEAGWSQGYTVANADWNAIPQYGYDDTPSGDQAGKTLYDEGFRAGYKWGYSDSSPFGAQRNCPRTDNDLAKTDSDGWYQFQTEKTPSLKVIYATPDASIGTDSNTALGNDSQTFILHAAKIESELNKNNGSLNISQVDILDGEMDASEAALTTEKFAQALYDMNKNNIEKVIKNGCQLTSPSIETKKYSNNSFTILGYMVGCPTGLDSGDKWNQVRYVFTKNKAGNRLFTIYFNNPNNVRKAGANEVDNSKLMNVPFIEQFLNKIKYE